MVAANKDWKLLNQWFLLAKLSHHFESFMVATIALVNRCGTSVSQMTTDMFHLL
jgi:hypothetical protein